MWELLPRSKYQGQILHSMLVAFARTSALTAAKSGSANFSVDERIDQKHNWLENLARISTEA